MMQAAGFGYPYGDYPTYSPGEMWTYFDLNLVHLCNVLEYVVDALGVPFNLCLK